MLPAWTAPRTSTVWLKWFSRTRTTMPLDRTRRSVCEARPGRGLGGALPFPGEAAARELDPSTADDPAGAPEGGRFPDERAYTGGRRWRADAVGSSSPSPASSPAPLPAAAT